MSDSIISVENLGKRYSLRHQQGERYTALRDVLSEKAASFFKKLKPENLKSGNSSCDLSVSESQNSSVSRAPAREDFWALRNISFTVNRGEVVGIIGRNGAGKSTLLKILSRITDPTEGRVRIKGRVASLLEVGTGFHPELTGRENIFLNGAILGMSRAEILAKFDEIVSFAEVEKFLDTPVKRYSSGMYVRLAFAVAAHLEPEILIVDEVLAVGDAEFQKKCLGKMDQVARREGRTVLFVSHNLIAIEMLCSSAILLCQGSTAALGCPKEIIGRYIDAGANLQPQQAWPIENAPGNASVRLRAVRVLNAGRQIQASFNTDLPITIEIEFSVLKQEALSVSCWLYTQQGMILLATADYQHLQWTEKKYEVGYYLSSCTIPGNYLNEGTYSVRAFVARGFTEALVDVLDAVSFTVTNGKNSLRGPEIKWVGVVRPLLLWQSEKISNVSGTAAAG